MTRGKRKGGEPDALPAKPIRTSTMGVTYVEDTEAARRLFETVLNSVRSAREKRLRREQEKRDGTKTNPASVARAS